MDVAVVKHSGEKTGRKVNLSAEVFGIEPNDHAIWLDVKSYLAKNPPLRAPPTLAAVR